MFTIQGSQRLAPNVVPFTDEDVNRYLAAKTSELACRRDEELSSRQRLRRVALAAALCLFSAQYYFFTVGVEILSMPTVAVFYPLKSRG